MKKIVNLFILLTILSGLTFAQVTEKIVKEVSTKKAEAKSTNAKMVDVRQQLQKEMKEMVGNARQADPDAFTVKKLQKIQSWDFQVGTQYTFWARNFRITDSEDEGYFYQVQATCRAVSDYAYVFVENTSWDSSYVNQNSADVVSNAFSYSTPADPNRGIYDIDTEVFGFPFDVDNDPRIIILILDIQDNFGIDGNNSYTGGYNHVYNSFTVAEGATYSNEMEMFYQDSYPADAMSEDGLLDIGATLAHEFQHMIEDGNHYLVNGLDQETFFDEGCSETASVVCGYPGRSSNYYATETNRNLVSWRDGSAVLGDYERAFRFMLYMYEQFGSDFLTKFISAISPNNGQPQVGFSAFDIAMPNLDTPTSRRQKDIIWDWHIASAVEDKSVDSKWGFDESVIRRVTGEVLDQPNVTEDSVLVEKGGAVFLTLKSGSNINATFSFGSNRYPQYVPASVKIFAVKGTGASTQVMEITPDEAVNFPEFGSTYEELTFIVSNSSNTSNFYVDYSISGEGGGQVTGPQELAYDNTEPTGVLNSTPGDTVAVVFDGMSGMRLDSIKVALRQAGSVIGGVYRFTGASRPTPLGEPLAVPIEAISTIATKPVHDGTSYPIPYPNWVRVDFTDQDIDASTDFAVAFVVEGEYPATNRVMITEIPGSSSYHSYTYLNNPSSGIPDWYYISASETTIYIYLIRAYVSSSATGTEVIELLPQEFTLNQNYPNPFNPTTNITYSIPEKSNVQLTIYDILGKEVASLVNEELASGTYKTTWNGKDSFGHKVSSGIYFYTIRAGNFVQTNKMILLK